MDHKKYKDIQQRIDKLTKQDPILKPPANANQVFNIAVEMVASVIVGLMIGLFFDNLFDSKPIFLIICLILSMVAAFRLIWNKYIKNNGT